MKDKHKEAATMRENTPAEPGEAELLSHALWFNRGMGPKIQGFISGLFPTVSIDRLCQWESIMATLSPGLKHQCTMEKTQQI